MNMTTLYDTRRRSVHLPRLFFLNICAALGTAKSTSRFHDFVNAQNRMNRAPQDETWPGERVVVWSYAGRPALIEVLARLRGEGEFNVDELVVTDFGDDSPALFLEVANGHRPFEDLRLERVDGVPVLHLPSDFARVHPLALRKLLWLLPRDSIYLVTHESVDPRNLA